MHLTAKPLTRKSQSINWVSSFSEKLTSNFDYLDPSKVTINKQSQRANSQS